MAKKKEVSIYEESQQRLVGSLLVNADDIENIVAIVSEEDFEDPALSTIYAAMVELTRANKGVTAFSVASYLESTGDYENVGGDAFLEELYFNAESDWITSAPKENYASIIKDSSIKRIVKETTDEAKDSLKYDSGVSAKQVVESLQDDLSEALYSISDETTITNVNENVEYYLNLVEERRQTYEKNKDANDGLQGIPSSIDSLNTFTTGWLPGQMITVAARTGVGKTVLAVNSATAAARANKSVLFFSLEMGSDEIQDRIYSSISSVPMKELKQGNLSDESKDWLKESVEEFKDLKIAIDTDSELTVDDIRAKAVKKAQSEEGLDFIIVDYLQLIRPNGKFGSRQEAVQDVSRKIKRLAKQLEVPIMILAQLNKAKDDEDNMPRMDDIRESYAIAQDSDIVVLLHRPKTDTDAVDPKTFVILEKNRNGESEKIIVCRSDLACSKFEEIRRGSRMDDESMSDNIESGIEDMIDSSMDESEKMFDDFEVSSSSHSEKNSSDDMQSFDDIDDSFLDEFDNDMPIGDDVLDMVDRL